MSSNKKITDHLNIKRTDHTNTPSALAFTPTPQMRKIKAEFWSRFEGEPTLLVHFEGEIDSSGLPAPLKGIPIKHWQDPQFVEWFNNRDEFKQRLEYLSHLALDTAEEILRNDEAPPAARVQMAKLVLEASGKTKADEKYLDQKIADMSREELEKYISGQLKVIAPSNSQDKETE